ncbi:TetR/AcrR family transcriptional regulator [Rhizobium halophytocola]|uniref:AcrR family transcriptional regulator n=1 Tax=Rhizobium halophytocola TaxID=735519 RepID=A0ABS4DXQ2_9HYPH|nr:TetR/AcrR family transcriptional regulator [Rhizobium halophytocola]MBP1850399.1 AcrR family transcriptional regulator [Rhizobium halophytocola]
MRKISTQSDTPAKAAPARDRILATAARLFYAQGIRATGIDRIIAEAGVAKMSFYNHFPSKDDLVRAFLVARHEMWMAMFRSRVQPHVEAQGLAAIALALGEWFAEPDFRGCAFINTVSEFDRDFPQAIAHKQDLAHYVEELAESLGLDSPQGVAAAAMIVIEGAIVRAQMGETEGLVECAQALLCMIEGRARSG